MNVYDFDKTIFYPDSSEQFFLYCLKRFPGRVLPVLPRGVCLAIACRLGKVEFPALKEQFFSFLPRIENLDAVVEEFWHKRMSGLQSWYLQQKREDDLIISASPEFLLRPVANALGIRLIATVIDCQSGKILGENCHDAAKLRRFNEQFPDDKIDEFYSDSLSDAPLAMAAERAFLVKKDKLFDWPKKSTGGMREE